jgi:hypothetical protein
MIEYEIKSCPGYYFTVSEDGEARIYSAWSRGITKGRDRISRIIEGSRREMSIQTSKFGYKIIRLKTIESIYKGCFVHRLIAETLVANPDNLECVDHIDGNKQNNHPSNLQWITRGGNLLKAQAMGKWGTPPATYQIFYESGHSEIITNINEFGRSNNYQASKLVAVSKNKRNRHKDVVKVVKLEVDKCP